MAMPPDKEITPNEIQAGEAGVKKPQNMGAGEKSGPDTEMKEGGGDPAKLAQDVGDGLAKLGELLNASQDASDDDKQKMAQIISLYTDLIQNSLSQDPNAPQTQKADPGAVSADAGMNGVAIAGPQSRQ